MMIMPTSIHLSSISSSPSTTILSRANRSCQHHHHHPTLLLFISDSSSSSSSSSTRNNNRTPRFQIPFLQYQYHHQKKKIRPSIQAMDSSSSSSTIPSQPTVVIPTHELKNESDFQSLLSPDRYLSICGFGSLLSERSARSTFPDLINFRIAKLNGFRRVFAHAAPIFFERGIANSQTQEISSLSVEPFDGETLVVTVFEIKECEIPSFIEREHEFRFLVVVPETLDGTPFTTPAVLCGRYSDEEYFQFRCKGSKEIYFQRYGRYGIDKIWRDDILPCRVYLRHCVLAAKNLSDEAYNNFLDHTFLGDRKTTIREYLATTGSGIMEEEPPELLKTRYGG